MRDAERLSHYRQYTNEIGIHFHTNTTQLQLDTEASVGFEAEDVKRAARRWSNDMLTDESLRSTARSPLSANVA